MKLIFLSTNGTPFPNIDSLFYKHISHYSDRAWQVRTVVHLLAKMAAIERVS